MAAYIPVPRDLTRVKTKVFLNLTKRQLLVSEAWDEEVVTGYICEECGEVK